MADLKMNAQTLAPLVLILVAAFVMLGVWNKVTALESRVVVLDSQVAQLSEMQAQVDALHATVVDVTADVASVANARDDILRTICDILEMRPERCGVG